MKPQHLSFLPSSSALCSWFARWVLHQYCSLRPHPLLISPSSSAVPSPSMHLPPSAHTCPPGTGGPLLHLPVAFLRVLYRRELSRTVLVCRQFLRAGSQPVPYPFLDVAPGWPPVLAQTIQSAVCKGFLTSTAPRQRAEAIPFPVSFVVWLERRVCNTHTSDAEVYQLGCLLCMIWASLRWSDVLWNPPSRIVLQLQQAALTGFSIRTKSSRHALGLPSVRPHGLGVVLLGHLLPVCLAAAMPQHPLSSCHSVTQCCLPCCLPAHEGALQVCRGSCPCSLRTGRATARTLSRLTASGSGSTLPRLLCCLGPVNCTWTGISAGFRVTTSLLVLMVLSLCTAAMTLHRHCSCNPKWLNASVLVVGLCSLPLAARTCLCLISLSACLHRSPFHCLSLCLWPCPRRRTLPILPCLFRTNRMPR